MAIANRSPRVPQCKKPSGWLGRVVLWNMNARHAKVTDWGLSHIPIKESFAVLDVGCGGGRTIGKLAAMITEGKVYGVDYSNESVIVSTKTNRQWIKQGRVEIREAPVSQLPFLNDMFDLVTAVETHLWWPDLPADAREVLRVLKPGGTLAIIAEVYKGANTTTAKLAEKYATVSGMAVLSADEHRALLETAGYTDVQVNVLADRGWICCVGNKPASRT